MNEAIAAILGTPQYKIGERVEFRRYADFSPEMATVAGHHLPDGNFCRFAELDCDNGDRWRAQMSKGRICVPDLTAFGPDGGTIGMIWGEVWPPGCVRAEDRTDRPLSSP